MLFFFFFFFFFFLKGGNLSSFKTKAIIILPCCRLLWSANMFFPIALLFLFHLMYIYIYNVHASPSDLVRRPVLLLGPLWEFVADRLAHDYPHEYVRCVPEVNQRASAEQLEAALLGGLVVEYRKRGHCWDVTTVQQLKDIADRVRNHFK